MDTNPTTKYINQLIHKLEITELAQLEILTKYGELQDAYIATLKQIALLKGKE